MVALLLWLILLVLCWPLALIALLLYPIVWLILLPFRILGIAVDGVLAFVRAVVMLPARLLGGTVLVVSPLISLMKDQVDALVRNGFRAAVLNSSLDFERRRDALRRLRAGEYELLYVAPEGLEGWLRTTWVPYTDRIPTEHRAPFLEELTQRAWARGNTNPNGEVLLPMVNLEVESERIPVRHRRATWNLTHQRQRMAQTGKL